MSKLKRALLVAVVLPTVLGGLITFVTVAVMKEAEERDRVTMATWIVASHFNDFKLYPWEDLVTITNLYSFDPNSGSRMEIQVIATRDSEYFATWYDLEQGQSIHVTLGPVIQGQGGQGPYARGLIPKP